MQILKQNKDEMKNIVKCDCGHKEYYGMVVMRNALNYCRKCIYRIWQDEDTRSTWRPNPKKDFIFPLYGDGKDYSKEE